MIKIRDGFSIQRISDGGFLVSVASINSNILFELQMNEAELLYTYLKRCFEKPTDEARASSLNPMDPCHEATEDFQTASRVENRSP